MWTSHYCHCYSYKIIQAKAPTGGRPNLTSMRATKQRSNCASKRFTSSAALGFEGERTLGGSILNKYLVRRNHHPNCYRSLRISINFLYAPQKWWSLWDPSPPTPLRAKQWKDPAIVLRTSNDSNVELKATNRILISLGGVTVTANCAQFPLSPLPCRAVCHFKTLNIFKHFTGRSFLLHPASSCFIQMHIANSTASCGFELHPTRGDDMKFDFAAMAGPTSTYLGPYLSIGLAIRHKGSPCEGIAEPQCKNEIWTPIPIYRLWLSLFNLLHLLQFALMSSLEMVYLS